MRAYDHNFNGFEVRIVANCLQKIYQIILIGEAWQPSLAPLGKFSDAVSKW